MKINLNLQVTNDSKLIYMALKELSKININHVNRSTATVALSVSCYDSRHEKQRFSEKAQSKYHIFLIFCN